MYYDGTLRKIAVDLLDPQTGDFGFFGPYQRGMDVRLQEDLARKANSAGGALQTKCSFV